jgi:hypothetical protein
MAFLDRRKCCGEPAEASTKKKTDVSPKIAPQNHHPHFEGVKYSLADG